MPIPVEVPLDITDVPSAPTPPPSGYGRRYSKNGLPYDLTPDGLEIGPSQFGFTSDLNPAGTANAGASGRVADASHVHPSGGPIGSYGNLDGGTAGSNYGGIAAIDCGGA